MNAYRAVLWFAIANLAAWFVILRWGLKLGWWAWLVPLVLAVIAWRLGRLR